MSESGPAMTLAIKVQPKSRRPGVQGWVADIEGRRLRIGVTEAAEAGRANKAVCAVLAKALGLRPAAVTVLQGASSRQKLLRIAGEPAELAQRLAALSLDETEHLA